MPDGRDTTLAAASRCRLGEGPLWSPREERLYWVDILAGMIWRYGLDGSTARTEAGGMPCSLVECEDGGFVLALSDSVLLLDSIEPFAVRRRVDAPWRPEVRANDGKVDASGAFWLGTMDRAEASPIGALYRFGPDLAGAVRKQALTISNGMAWSADGNTMYHVDSPSREIVAYDFDLAEGTLSNPRVHARVPPPGVPDGMCADVEGALWVAIWGAGCVRRYDPRGVMTEEIRLPCPYVTSCAFGGRDLDVLFITTAASRHGAEAGGLFACSPGVVGAAAHRFRL